ncbi:MULTISPECIES: energy-coupling factor transporter transmembrane protein EcfT [Clostridium]|uniref:Energy-coupling factor transporter transmembrane protein EcfT n=1 Tax=Clostridium ragsdalei P11 TaxID=1353534 RepID=A0A1A6ASI4_9CLOT|nr:MULTISPECIES: energy-coupling factor transporter transmembrane component T [Clostridium]OBR92998.1 energy-coupling factor transporter transmembrane protein EcfT [Clostridium ragsdalei P11]QXE19084.1 transporter [Clostridium sp. 001]
MIKDITIGQYVPGNSFVHKLDPRVKILISLIYIVDLFIVNSFKGYIFIVLFTIISILISKIQFSYIYKGLKPIFILVIITAVLNIFMTTGINPPLFKWKFLVVYKEGLVMAAFMAIRLIFLIIGTSLLTLTTSPIELTDAIEKLLNPMKKIGVPAHELAMMMTIALRFIPTLMDETDKIMKAQMARGADFQSGNIIQRAKNLIPILVPLFISSFRRADELAMAMEARCYTGGEGRTRMKQLKLTNKDFMASVCVFALVCVSILSRMWWH